MATLKLIMPDTLYNELIVLAREYHKLDTPTASQSPRRKHVRELLASKLTGALMSNLRISGVIET
jgi:hypothetical protein